MNTVEWLTGAAGSFVQLDVSPSKAEDLLIPASKTSNTARNKQGLWKKLDFDTNVLRIETATALPSLAVRDLKSVIHECASEGVGLLYWSPAPEQGSAVDASVSQFWFTGYAVASAVLFRRDVSSLAADHPNDANGSGGGCERIESVPPSDEPDETLIALGLISGEHSRFRRDPALTRAQFEAMYRAWVCNSVNRRAADDVLVCREQNGEISGMITLKLARDRRDDGANDKRGLRENTKENVRGGACPVQQPPSLPPTASAVVIGLLAVSPRFQRQGIGRKLIRAAFQWAQKRHASVIEVVTQEENVGAMRFYAAQGFRQVSRKANYHIWIPSSVAGSGVRFNVPYLTGREKQALSDVIDDNALDSLGKYTRRCEEWMERTLGSPKALLTHSATAALEQAAILCELREGDEVVMPSYTFVSTANAVVLRGAVPVFVDVVPEDIMIDVNAIEAAITGKTAAIIVVHYAGMPCDMDPIMALAKKHDLYVIEDAAQALLSKYKGKYLGTIGHFGCFSFHYTKNTVCGEGGALLVNDENFLVRSRIVREKGTNRSDFMDKQVSKYEWLSLGSSFEPNELSAAFLLPQLEDAPECRNRRLRVCFAYHTLLDPLEKAGKLTRVACNKDAAESASCGNGHIFWIMFNSPSEREAAELRMQTHGVQCLRHYVPLHLSPGGRRYARCVGSMRTTVKVGENLLRLPVWAGMTWAHVHLVVKCLYTFFTMEAPSHKEVMGFFFPLKEG